MGREQVVCIHVFKQKKAKNPLIFMQSSRVEHGTSKRGSPQHTQTHFKGRLFFFPFVVPTAPGLNWIKDVQDSEGTLS